MTLADFRASRAPACRFPGWSPARREDHRAHPDIAALGRGNPRRRWNRPGRALLPLDGHRVDRHGGHGIADSRPKIEGHRRRGRHDSGAAGLARPDAGHVGQRLERGGDTGCRVRVRNRDRLAGGDGGDLRRRRLLRRGRGLAPQATGIDDVGWRLRPGFAVFSRWRRSRLPGGPHDLRVGRGELERVRGFMRGIDGTGSTDLSAALAAAT